MRTITDRLKQLFLSSWHPFAWIFFLGLFLYLRILSFHLTFLDDQKMVLEYQWLFKDPFNAWKLFLRCFETEIFYRPVMILSFMVSALVSGTSPWAYHLMNIILHNINAYLIFILLQRLGYDRVKSFIFSIIFLVHPMFVTAVAWIPGRTDSLVALFIFASFLFFMDFIKEGKAWAFIGHIVFFILALLSKEIALVLPLACAMYLICLRPRDMDLFKAKPDEEARLLRKGIKVTVIVWAIILLLWLWVRKIVSGSALTLYFVDKGKIPIAFLPNSVIHTGKVLFPFNLTVVPILEDTTIIYGVAAIVVLVLLIIFSRQKRLPFIWFGLSWYSLFLIPSCLGAGVILEYRAYIPFLGVAILLLETDLVKKFFTMGRRGIILGVVIIFGLAAITFYYTTSFKDQFTYWGKAVKDSPHLPLAHRNLGAMLYLAGDWDNATKEYEKALGLNPQEPMAHNNLGLIYMNRGRLYEAEREFQQEIAINPSYADAYYNFALLRYRQGRRDEARALIFKALEINPDHIDAYQVLTADYYREGNEQETARYLKELEKRKVPATREFLENLVF